MSQRKDIKRFWIGRKKEWKQCTFSYYYLLLAFFTSALADGLSLKFEWWQDSRTVLSILAVLNNAVVWMGSSHPTTSKSSSPFNNPLVIVPKAPVIIGLIITCMFHSFFNPLARSRYLSFFSFSFSFILWSSTTAKSTILQVVFFLIIRASLQAKIRRSVCTSKSHRSLCVSFSWTAAGLYLYNLFVWSNLKFWQISQRIILPTQSCLVLNSFCANLLIMPLMVSCLSTHNLHLLFCCILSILALIWLVLMALSWAAIRRDSVSLLRLTFLSQVQVFSSEMLFIRRLKRPWSCFLPIFVS